MKAITSDNAPKAIGPYSQAMMHNGMLFVSGQLGVNPKTGIWGETFAEQAKLVFENLKAILTDAGMDFGNVVKVSCFLKDLGHFELLNDLYKKYFVQPYPAREAYQVAKLPKDAEVEISLIAMK
ncbi:MAG: RidA family protein [Candidatus Cloacimonetes bacterium]|nr:RidA family protein [Candidatus Cloacimonadota bacterium]